MNIRIPIFNGYWGFLITCRKGREKSDGCYACWSAKNGLIWRRAEKEIALILRVDRHRGGEQTLQCRWAVARSQSLLWPARLRGERPTALLGHLTQLAQCGGNVSSVEDTPYSTRNSYGGLEMVGYPKSPWVSIVKWSNFGWFGVPLWLRKPHVAGAEGTPWARKSWQTFDGGGEKLNKQHGFVGN